LTKQEHISISTERIDNDLVKIVWRDLMTGLSFEPYQVYRKELNKKGARTRAALELLQIEYLKIRPNYSEPIAELTARGHELYTALFEDCRPEDKRTYKAAEARDWFEGLNASKSSVVVTVHADPVLPIPWGLLHERGPTADGSDPCEGFWALRHQVAALYNGMSPQRLRTARPSQNVMLLSALNQEIYEKTKQHLDCKQQEFLSAFLDRPVGRAFSTHGCSVRWQEVGDKDCVIHFFGHASGSELRFSDSDLLTAGSFRGLFRRESRVVRPRIEPVYVLSILNGCASVSGKGADSFLIATADPGFCGFIGAEAVVPDRFALMFGQELLHALMVEGVPVRRAMTQLWQKHRPMALFYGCYAHPDFAITRSKEYLSLPPGFEIRNYH
jgi:hypothetical protein